MRSTYRRGETTYDVTLERGTTPTFTCGTTTVPMDVVRVERGEVTLRIDGTLVRAFVAAVGDKRYVRVVGGPVLEFDAGEAARTKRRLAAASGDALVATMHGQVVKVNAKVGDAVKRGDTLVVLEAMKMEMKLNAPHDGVVKRVDCTEGEVVERGKVLVELTDH